tara:strand:+ start:235 stop:576 length:342 start_codon:yes stop_codon:yes gene_type:complete
LLPKRLTIKTPIIIKAKPISEYKLGNWLNLNIPTTTVAIIVNPANDAYVIPIGMFFITNERAYIHSTIVIAVIILGNSKVNPSALFAKLFEVTPRNTATAKNKYEEARLMIRF